MIERLLNLPRFGRRALLLVLDGTVITLSLWLALVLRLGDEWREVVAEAWPLLPLLVGVGLSVFWILGFYRPILRYAGRDLFNTLIKGIGLSLIAVMAMWLLLRGGFIPRTVWFLIALLMLTLIGGSRLLLRDYVTRRFAMNATRKPVIIYGAGVAGIQLASALKHDPVYLPVAFADDNHELQHSVIVGLKVYHPRQLDAVLEREQIDAILLAIPSASRAQRRTILNRLAVLQVRLLVMPSMTELASGAKRIDELREVDVEDILGRDPVKPQPELLAACITDKTVMVTGAGGSIGAELCRQILQLRPQRLVLFDLSEYALYAIERDLRERLDKTSGATELVAVLGSVNQRLQVESTLRRYAVQTIYHAAAYKHLPLVEQNPLAGVQTNVFGTLRTAEAALATGVETFVFISTDKAVRPCNIMGSTKRLAELILQALASTQTTTRFCMVRFGNVLGSSGSVVPLFREQIRRGGPVTVTHPAATRYFMTIPEAAQLVIQAGSLAQGGEVYLLDMGEPVKILALAQRMIELSGYQLRNDQHPDGDIAIEFIGLREGEKLHEELLISGNDAPTAHPMIKQATEEALPWSVVRQYLSRLHQAAEAADERAVREWLRVIVTQPVTLPSPPAERLHAPVTVSAPRRLQTVG